MQYTLTPGHYDVDRYGWELESEEERCIACIDSFANDDATDTRLAQAWANQLLGKQLDWTRTANCCGSGHHYTAED
ncbi:hypothetical protein [Kitasatospora sp. A2-31]|uniref:hypothetical protein n=1 Tax=Kitasatospora sp. A2-31 TaxID=2916414 RepID=UPI001EEBC693|nr:hypothetical protein [Kitasatospora sp. A2-31]MCG6497629.1 hypothetical protein [Kitasatospora sp. A2-31]